MEINDELKQECIERLKLLKLDEKIIQDFIDNDKVYATIINGDIIEVTQYEVVSRLMKSFENNKQVKVYHIVSIEEELKSLVYVLYVSNNKDEWKAERGDIRKGFVEVSTFEERRIYDNKAIGIEVNNGKIIKVTR